MTLQLNITIPLPKPVAEFYGKEARRRMRAKKRYVSRSAVMREVLTHYAEVSECQPIQSAKTPAT